MTIERTSDEIIFKVSNDISLDELQDIANLLEFKSIVQKSNATQREVNSLVKEVKKGRWKKTKSLLKL